MCAEYENQMDNNGFNTMGCSGHFQLRSKLTEKKHQPQGFNIKPKAESECQTASNHISSVDMGLKQLENEMSKLMLRVSE